MAGLSYLSQSFKPPIHKVSNFTYLLQHIRIQLYFEDMSYPLLLP